MQGFLMRSVAIAALVLTPLSAMAQGGPNGPGSDAGRGPGAGGGRMDHEGGMQRGEGQQHGGGNMQRGDGMQRGEGMRGDRHDADRGDKNDRHDADRGDKGDRHDADRGDKGDHRDADRGDRGDRRDADRGDRMDRPGMDRPGEMRRDGGPRERIGERGLRRGPVRVVSTEQRTRIRSVIRGRGFDSIRGGDFAVRVGAAVPGRYQFRPLPPEILSYVPEYEGYDYIVVDDQILILDPETREVVAIIS